MTKKNETVDELLERLEDLYQKAQAACDAQHEPRHGGYDWDESYAPVAVFDLELALDQAWPHLRDEIRRLQESIHELEETVNDLEEERNQLKVDHSIEYTRRRQLMNETIPEREAWFKKEIARLQKYAEIQYDKLRKREAKWQKESHEAATYWAEKCRELTTQRDRFAQFIRERVACPGDNPSVVLEAREVLKEKKK